MIRRWACAGAGALWRRRWMLARLAGVCLALAALILGWPMDTRWYLEVNPSLELRARDGRALFVFVNREDQWLMPRSLDQISPHMIDATLAVEDQRFLWHPGVDPIAIIRAVLNNLHHGRVRSGASTLTMQVAKRVDRRTRSMGGKLRQAVRALRLELRASKEEIFTAYLNSAPYGQNLVGCEAAARRYFGKSALELTLPEAATLAGLPRSPTWLSPLNHPERALARRNHVLDRMWADGVIDTARWRLAQAAPLGARRHAFARLAPHVAMRLRASMRRNGSTRVTLDAFTQARAEQIVREAVDELGEDVTNAAALIVDAPCGDIRAWVGSADFFGAPGGQVDAARAPRSPGSTLKPFLYALAMARQRLYASETLLDAPLDYGRFDPENYDRHFRGLVRADQALRLSLNVPAVQVLHRLGVDTSVAFLREIGLTTLPHAPERYGLGVILGSGEARLDELTAAYRMLATGGARASLRLMASAHDASPMREQNDRLLPGGVCRAIYQALERPLPGETDLDRLQAVRGQTRVAWKTGTSTGYHDAWTFVWNRRLVVGVWVGNADGAASPKLIGAQAAAPLAARLFRMAESAGKTSNPTLEHNHADPFEKESALRPVRVCANSGLPATPACPHTRIAWLPREQYLHRRCELHAPDVLAPRWPAAAPGWDLAQIDTQAFATAEPSVSQLGDSFLSEPIRIINPPDGAEFIHIGATDSDRLRLRAAPEPDTPIHWYLNDRYLGVSTPQAALRLSLTPGSHQLTCLTADGRLDKSQYTVLTQNRTAIH